MVGESRGLALWAQDSMAAETVVVPQACGGKHGSVKEGLRFGLFARCQHADGELWTQGCDMVREKDHFVRFFSVVRKTDKRNGGTMLTEYGSELLLQGFID